MAAMPIDTDMIDASAPVSTPDTALAATSHPELVLPTHVETCHAPAASNASMTTAVTAKPTTPASATPRPHYVDIPKTDAYALSLDVAAIELDRQPGANTNMHGIGEDFLGTSAPDILQTDDASTQSTELLYCRVKVPQLVAAQLQAIWADAVANAPEYIRDAVKRKHHDSITAGIQHLLMLVSEVLGDNRGGSGQRRKAAARVRDLRKRARAADRACEEAPFASALSVAKRAAVRTSASAWEIARCRAAIRRALRSGLHPAHSAVRPGGEAFHGRPCLLKPSQRRVCLKPHCASEGQSLVRSPRQRCVGEGCGGQARSCRDVFAEASQAHAAMPVRELHLHPFLIRETCYADDVTHAAD